MDYITHQIIAANTKSYQTHVRPATPTAVYLQISGQEYNANQIEARVRAAFAADGRSTGAIRAMELYIKPEERKVYYVINNKHRGSIDL